MEKKYLDENGLLYFWQKIGLLFVRKDGNKVLSTNDYTTTEKNKLAGIEAGAQVNVLEDVKVNGVSLVPTGKAVNVDLTDYAKKADVAGGVHVKGSVNTYADLPTSEQEIGDMYNVKTADATHGIAAGDNVVWDGSAWDNFGGTIDLSGYATTDQLELKVDKVTGKGLSTNDYTTSEKTKLAGIETGAQVNTVTGVKGSGETAYRTGNVNITKANIGLGNVDNTADADKPISTAVQTALNGKVSTVTGKGLSTNDFTTALKNKLAGIEAGAQVNVQSDWAVTDTSSAAYIKNKPTIPSGTVVDDAMSSTSENPVQNKVIVSELANYLKTTDIVAITNAEIDTIVSA